MRGSASRSRSSPDAEAVIFGVHVLINCVECFNQDKNVSVDVEFTNDTILKFKCPEGHETIVNLHHYRHHILFNYALSSYLTRNYHSAVSIAAVTIERAREHYINCKLNKIPSDLEEESEDKKFKEMWKRIGTTERQFGAFISLYLKYENEIPVDLDKVPSTNHSATSLRNKVIHNGYIPEEQECLEYLRIAFEYIKDIEFRADSPDESHYRKWRWVDDSKKIGKMLSNKDNISTISVGMGSTISPIYKFDSAGGLKISRNNYTLEDAISFTKGTIRVESLTENMRK